MVKALIAISSYNGVFYDDGAKTGLFVVEALHPYNAFKAKGYDVDFVSETGTFGVDEHSLSEDFLNGNDLAVYQDSHSEFSVDLSKIKKASDVSAEDYSIFFASAGHATLFDYPKAKDLQSIAQKIYSKGGVVAAVCHGPAIFDGLHNTATGRPLIEGKTITGFTDIGEDILGVTKAIKENNLLTVEDIAKKYGATYSSPAGPWDDYSVVDGRIVTGANPASAFSTAAKAIKALD